ncbi:AraC family transcriptional regulator [Billgrantia tianxiuensis]|uniref:AraC family transcriptional regulator n=1 Tax=Billgrantia tianxiuensis TaxID=2497861 RepID=A0A6I6SJK3_9GAMM|nr:MULTISPECIES: AraC family transcriptional regulator [Halomonas]MCE8032319.1 helix-turn-helix transcriptional regulator [Halomonas sp. MCCC 1A11057]QHC49692.1 AraC family transcriptional regulator [Halomonas tianxiuensis]
MTLSTAVCQHTSRDLRTYGERYGIDYRFPTQPPAAAGQAVLRGHILELAPAAGMQLIASDIEVLQRYDSCSHRPAPLSIIVMLEGRAQIGLGEKRLAFTSGMALSVRLDEHQGLQAMQLPGQRIRALTLALDAPRLAATLGGKPSRPGSSLHAWTLPSGLQQLIDQALNSPLDGMASRLQWEGLALQLLAHGLPTELDVSSARLSPGEWQRLERVREQLQSCPARSHSLSALAEQAAMSPATLRRKFQAAYGCSVFDFLRERRLELARELLLQGHGIERAAQCAGYRHANNFTTAFRQRYGYPPSSLRGAG